MILISEDTSILIARNLLIQKLQCVSTSSPLQPIYGSSLYFQYQPLSVLFIVTNKRTQIALPIEASGIEFLEDFQVLLCYQVLANRQGLCGLCEVAPYQSMLQDDMCFCSKCLELSYYHCIVGLLCMHNILHMCFYHPCQGHYYQLKRGHDEGLPLCYPLLQENNSDITPRQHRISCTKLWLQLNSNRALPCQRCQTVQKNGFGLPY